MCNSYTQHSLAAEIEEDKEFWFEKVNVNLKNLLKKENKDTSMQRNMVRHYYTRNMVCNVRFKNMKKKLKKTLKKLKKMDNIDLLADASLVV